MTNNNTKWILGHKVTIHETSGNYDLLLGETPAGMQGPPPHIHKTYKESFLVIEGEMDFMINGKDTKVKAGESVDIPPNSLHTFSNNSDKPSKWINIHSPKGFRSFFEEMSVNADMHDAKMKSLSSDLVKKVLDQAADFDMFIDL